MSTLQIAEMALQLTELQNTVMADNVDLNMRLLEVTAAVATPASQLKANASAVEDNDKRVKEVIVTVAGKLGQSDAVFDNLQNSVRMQRKTMEDLEDKLKGPQHTQHLTRPVRDPFLISKHFLNVRH